MTGRVVNHQRRSSPAKQRANNEAEKQREDEISFNDIMVGLLEADMLSHSASGQVTLIFISARNVIYTCCVGVIFFPLIFFLCRSFSFAPQIFMSSV